VNLETTNIEDEKRTFAAARNLVFNLKGGYSPFDQTSWYVRVNQILFRQLT
jgi:hypothetical protein